MRAVRRVTGVLAVVLGVPLLAGCPSNQLQSIGVLSGLGASVASHEGALHRYERECAALDLADRLSARPGTAGTLGASCAQLSEGAVQAARASQALKAYTAALGRLADAADVTLSADLSKALGALGAIPDVEINAALGAGFMALVDALAAMATRSYQLSELREAIANAEPHVGRLAKAVERFAKGARTNLKVQLALVEDLRGEMERVADDRQRAAEAPPEPTRTKRKAPRKGTPEPPAARGDAIGAAEAELKEREETVAKHAEELQRREHVFAQRWTRLQHATCSHCGKPVGDPNA